MSEPFSRLEKDLVRKINVLNNKKYKNKDLMEWSTSEVKAEEGETLYKIDGINVAMKDKVKEINQ